MASIDMQPYYTIRETMELIHVSQRSIYSYLKSGKLEGTKTASGTWRISRGSVLKFLGVEDDQEG